MMNSFFNALKEIVSNIENAIQQIDRDSLEKAINHIIQAKKIFCYGAGRSGLVARAFAQRLMHIGLNSYFIGETITPSCRDEDVVIIVSGSGETTSSVCIARKAKEVGATVLSVTAHRESTLAKLSDLILYVPGKTKLVEKKSYAPFTSLFDITTLSVLDSIAAELMDRLKVDENIIQERHANVE